MDIVDLSKIFRQDLQASFGSIVHLKWFETGTCFDLVSTLYWLYLFHFPGCKFDGLRYPKGAKEATLLILPATIYWTNAKKHLEDVWAIYKFRCLGPPTCSVENIRYSDLETYAFALSVSGFVRGVLSAPKQLCNSVSVPCIFFQRHCICAELSENRQARNIGVFSGLWASLNEFLAESY